MLLGGYQIIDLSQLGVLSTTEENPSLLEIVINENSNKNLYDTITQYLELDKICFLTGIKVKHYDFKMTFDISGVCVKQERVDYDNNGNILGKTNTLSVSYRTTSEYWGILVCIDRIANIGYEPHIRISIAFDFNNL